VFPGARLGEEKQTIHEFGEFQLDAVRQVLSRNGRPVALPYKVFETLGLLVLNRGQTRPGGATRIQLALRAFPCSTMLSIKRVLPT
jgi:hypothetical protein